MIKFFRNIRRRLLTENKFTKYLVYAIGEIILVVIGILIALQINNWNEEQNKDQRSSYVYQALINNIQMNIEDLKNNLRIDSSARSSISYVLNLLEEKPPYDETTMPQHFGRMSMYSNFFDHRSAYENLKSIGFDFIRNDSLRNEITNYYDVTCDYLLRIQNGVFNVHEDMFVKPFMMEHFDYSSFFNPAYPRNYNNLINHPNLKSILATTDRLFEWKKARSEDVISEGEDLINKINTEIQRNNNRLK